ncbi:MAG: PIN domain nuclease [Pyrinomonadaceae bacterium]
MILVDSSVWIDFFRANETPQTIKLKSLLGIEQVAVGDLILAEVLQGCHQPGSFDSTRKALDRLEFIQLCAYRVSIEAAANFLKLRALGYTIRKTIDTIIATKCILSGIELLHNDRDFLPFEKHLGLKSVIPTTDN